MVPANNSQKINDEFFNKLYKGYKVPEHETGIYHVALESRTFDVATGVKLSKSIVQKYTPDVFRKMVDNDGFKGMAVHILHNPEGKAAPQEITKPGLEAIQGIGAKTAAAMKKQGISSLQKLAALTEIEAVDLGNKIKGVTAEELLNDWIPQAKELISE